MFLKLLLCDPRVFERRQTSENRSAIKRRVFVRIDGYINRLTGRKQSSQLSFDSISQDQAGANILTHINISGGNGFEGQLVDLMPGKDFPIREGLNRASEHLVSSAVMGSTLPSGKLNEESASFSLRSLKTEVVFPFALKVSLLEKLRHHLL